MLVGIKWFHARKVSGSCDVSLPFKTTFLLILDQHKLGGISDLIRFGGNGWSRPGKKSWICILNWARTYQPLYHLVNYDIDVF